ncbi:hypothetical protein Pse7367_0059 [Thalassoporum mexicanum PCC 7367]|nr:hypothetical protein [Pseudanabaena sp. PCC 7367]AFY68378.1 hypothetical protein Pse7367_0059 [Pseudanabaena sp. PCC 7367]
MFSIKYIKYSLCIFLTNLDLYSKSRFKPEGVDLIALAEYLVLNI